MSRSPYRDPELGRWLKERREEVGLTQADVADLCWAAFRVPLRGDVLSAIELGRRFPTAHHVEVLIRALGLTPDQRDWVVERWALGPAPRLFVINAATWHRYLRTESSPSIPVRRKLIPVQCPPTGYRGESPDPTEAVSMFKLRMTEDESTLLNAFASMNQTEPSEVVRRVVRYAIESGWEPPAESEVPSPRSTDRSFRFKLSSAERLRWRTISRGHKFQFWCYLALRDAINTGWGAAVVRGETPAAAPAASEPSVLPTTGRETTGDAVVG